VIFPFDHFPGPFLRYNNLNIKEDIRRVFSGLFTQDKEEENKRMKPMYAIHIRRGDVSPHRHPQWYISDSHYCRLIDALYLLHSGDLSIEVISQGDIMLESQSCREMKLLNRLNISTCQEQWTNSMEIGAIRSMLRADYIVGGLSSFSMLPSWINHGKHIISYRHRGVGNYPHPMSICGEIFTDEGIETLVDKLSLITKSIDQCIV